MQDATLLIPHQAPMIFVDELCETGDDYVITQLTIRPELMFYEPEGLPSWVAIEIMAQSIAVFAGVQGKKNQQSPKVGYLLGTRKMNLPISHFKPNDVLKIKVQQLYLHEGLGQFQCELSNAEQTLSAVLSVYQP
ncbi:3-hydroxylacyl-ACP dehydratase [Acinetobacter sp. MD2(2019)]|uniref:ApeP family dehydratase n=1 Tax=Acinetobacter sp. MD2(2019) TaxID=2605273 RepID=UPI002D1F477A|nr:3-hydroxylacyl-ACP dehydratase [Acinetobacter sp. MD2(2019)]MEB3753615.1 3-hydroxylacyl-ACP dehydratase [Acinetobacter sp. MD2(2019)]